MQKPEFILCSAIHFQNGAKSTVLNIESGVIVCGRRHGDCYEIIKSLLGVDIANIPNNKSKDIVGFLTSKNRFVNRSEAFKIAKLNNQITHNMFDKDDEGILTSEDLYWGDNKNDKYSEEIL
ncbi:MAG: hypothetical protein IPJ01_10270 [Micavibrio sp.]|nr:hypothetical protein [Micavibrio sp.]